jgi:hypothetical protein
MVKMVDMEHEEAPPLIILEKFLHLISTENWGK